MVKRFSGASMFSNAKLIIEEAGNYIAKPFDKYLIKCKLTNAVIFECETIEELYEWAMSL